MWDTVRRGTECGDEVEPNQLTNHLMNKATRAASEEKGDMDDFPRKKGWRGVEVCVREREPEKDE